MAWKRNQFGPYVGITLKLEDGRKAWFRRTPHQQNSFEVQVGDPIEVTGETEVTDGGLVVVKPSALTVDGSDLSHPVHIADFSGCLHAELVRSTAIPDTYECKLCAIHFTTSVWHGGPVTGALVGKQDVPAFFEKAAESIAPTPEPEAPQSYSDEKDAFLSQFLT